MGSLAHSTTTHASAGATNEGHVMTISSPLTGVYSIDTRICITPHEELGSPCWIFTGSLTRRGYGQIRLRGKTVSAHRTAFTNRCGPIPDGLELDHLCVRPACVNPSHLEPVTHAENIRRSSAAARKNAQTHCKHGHEYTPENTSRSKGKRSCKTCMQERARIYYENKVKGSANQ